MSNPLQILWYINPHDGPYPWHPDGVLPYDPLRIREIAVAADKAGYYGALTVGKNAFIEAASFIPVTETLRYLIPVYPGQYGRTLAAGTLANIIVRETEEEAWDYARQILEKTGVENIVRQIKGRLNLGRFNVALNSRDIPTFETLKSDDPQIQGRLDKLRAGKLPDVKELESYPNIWSGPNGWGALDVLDQGWGGYLVGSAKNVADRIKELQATLGIDAFILAGWPLRDEAQRVADLLFPLLERDLSRPVLAPERHPKIATSFDKAAE